MYLRGGSGVVFNNTFTGEFNNPIHLTNYRSWTTCGGTGVDPDSCTEGYPCKDQILGLYLWNNTYNGNLINATVDDRGLNTLHIQQDRDYFNTQKTGYTPYTYPHPLVIEQDGLGIRDKKFINQCKLFPNPARDKLSIEFYLSSSGKIIVKLYDISGKYLETLENVVLKQGKHTLMQNISGYKKGIYIIQINTEKFSETRKLIIL